MNNTSQMKTASTGYTLYADSNLENIQKMCTNKHDRFLN